MKSIPTGRAFLLVTVLALGYLGGWVHSYEKASALVDQLVAYRWVENPDSGRSYGVHVFLVPGRGTYSVRARITSGLGSGIWHSLGEIARADSPTEAIRTWGAIRVRDQGIEIGSSEHGAGRLDQRTPAPPERPSAAPVEPYFVRFEEFAAPKNE